MENSRILPSYLNTDPEKVHKTMGLVTASSVAVRDREGRGLVLFIKNALNMPWEEGTNLIKVVSHAITKLTDTYKPPAPSPTDYWHKEF
jgi:hypothetical protein